MKKTSSLRLVASRGTVAFASKAETLERLGAVIKSAVVLPQYRITVGEWAKNSDAIVNQLLNLEWTKQSVVVRSSAFAEDAANASLAGHFESVLNVKGKVALKSAIEKVAKSYRQASPKDQIFIQPMCQDVQMSGVAFTADPSTKTPYYVINYDDKTGSTESVTGGKSNELHTYYYFPNSKVQPPKPLDAITSLLEELTFVLDNDALDIEFAMDRKGTVYLFQCRPLVGLPSFERTKLQVSSALENIEKKFRALNQPHPYLYGIHTVLGVMPDWNPAEIIGIRPRPLALSLYKELITDSIWAYQRDNYGYKNLRSFPLLISFAGLPYIDVRVSFNSFVPRDIEAPLGEKLVNYYIQKLADSPTDHDKVEFAVLNTCYTLDLNHRLKDLREHGFSEAECTRLTDSLRNLTNQIIHSEQGLWRKDIEKIKKLEERLSNIKNSRLDTNSKIYWLMEDCKRYGTLPFAGLARAGFIAVQLLQSLRNVGVLGKEEYDNFMSSLETVSSRMKRDLRDLPKAEFLERYGHLRPGTYDILSARYDENPDKYFDWKNLPQEPDVPHPTFALSLTQLKKIEKLLAEHRLEHDVIGFFEFIKAAIEGRELAKFVFTRSLSDALSLLKELGGEFGISEEDCSFVDINAVKTLYSSSLPAEEVLRRSIAENRERYQLTQKLILPPLIVHPEDIWSFELPSSEPNYITQKSISTKIVFSTEPAASFRGKIILIPSADPGYDWIFSHGIAGLITMYGGANSHMAIRAGELGIPAVIGAGEKLYKMWSQAHELYIDCGNRKVQVVR
jgi:glutamine kinase